MAYLLDTNILSELTRSQPEPKVTTWMDRHYGEAGTATPVIMELYLGVMILPEGARKQMLWAAIERARHRLGARIYPFDLAAALATAKLVASRRKSGRPFEDTADAQIAGIASAYDLILVTRNVSDFGGLDIKLENPWGA